ncbi:DUF5106 domain-containing protein [Dysgonomonas sp. ZJ279]|uniref:DUF5106 domain-containing protein n=1 Tax=Dysgonomonas sp. ZJ279 TaxID=2709796 RepID=UPI002104607A|nr:DUF5106 domain-containing protein [Dysgonomonas sp. ZJ279]
MKNISISRILIWIIYPLLIFLFMTFCFFKCSSGHTKEGEASSEGEKKREFVMISIPANITTPKDRGDFLVAHYWDNFDFSDTVYTNLPQITEQAFVNYIEVLPLTERNIAATSIQKLLGEAEKEETGRMYSYFKELSEKYLYDPNSPLRNEELYIPVAEYIVTDSKTNDSDKERIKFDLDMMYKNRIGEKATDISYTLQSGKKGTLYNIEGNYTIVLFYNPDCHACAEIISYIKASPTLNNKLEDKSLAILALYPDKDLEIWEKHLNDIPSNWVNSYDKEQIVMNKKQYDLKAIPTLYLLDKDKKIILKDANIQEIEKYLNETNTPSYILK